MKSKRKRERERASYRDKRRGEKGRQIVKEGWASAWKSCIGAAASLVTLPPPTLSSRAASNQRKSRDPDVGERVDRLQRNRGRSSTLGQGKNFPFDRSSSAEEMSKMWMNLARCDRSSVCQNIRFINQKRREFQFGGARNGRDLRGAVVVVIEAIKGNNGGRSVIKLAPRFLERGALACYVLILCTKVDRFRKTDLGLIETVFQL